MNHLYLHAKEIEGLWPLHENGELKPQKGKLIRIDSFRHGMNIPTGRVRPSFSEEGFRQGYVQHGPLTIVRHLDSCSPLIINTFLSRTVMKGVEIVSCELVEKETGGLLKQSVAIPTPIWVIRLGHVIISDFNYGPSADGHQEMLTLEYRSIQWSYRPLTIGDREEGSWVHTSWDGELNTAKKAELDDLKLAGNVFDPKLDKLFEP